VLVRTAVMIASLFGFAIAIAVQFLYPAAATYVFYALLAWIVASLFIYRLPVMNRQIGGGPSRAPPPPSYPPVSAPFGTTAGGGTPLASHDVGFCIHCGTNVAPGTTTCPTCGRSVSY
jgi:hypothetical protein